MSAEHKGDGGDAAPIGGQALIEGVMMLRGGAWGAAVRRTDGSIGTTTRAVPSGLATWRKIPLVRGTIALGASAGLGTRAMIWGAEERGDESGDGYSVVGLVLSVVIALTAVVGIFGLAPAAVAKAMGIHNALLFSLVEGLLRLGVLVGYLALLGRSAQVRRVFAYHGAEHMTIHAFEHGGDLSTDRIRTFDRRHPRCGTSFLLIVVLVTMVAHAVVGNPSWPVLVASRILGIPVVAGLAYETIRFAGNHQDNWFGRLLMAPGAWLQSLTTAEPTDDMIEVAVAALHATLADEDGALAVTEAPGLLSPAEGA